MIQATPMRSVHVIPGRQLTPDHLSAWTRFQENNADLDSPFYAPDLTNSPRRFATTSRWP